MISCIKTLYLKQFLLINQLRNIDQNQDFIAIEGIARGLLANHYVALDLIGAGYRLRLFYISNLSIEI